jgi:hypothetical protein
LNRWHSLMKYLSEMESAINWASNTSTKHVGIPDELFGGIISEPSERENAINQLLLRSRRSTPFSENPNRSLLILWEFWLLFDNVMCHARTCTARTRALK